MKINFSIPFKGVITVSSKNREKSNLNDIKRNIEAAEKKAEILKENGEDTFVVPHSTKNYCGQDEGLLSTYILTGKDARMVNKFDEAINDLKKLLNYGHSDRFEQIMYEKSQKIRAVQMEIAEFIAENRK